MKSEIVVPIHNIYGIDIPYVGRLTMTTERLPQGRHSQVYVLKDSHDEKYIYKKRDLDEQHFHKLNDHFSYTGFSSLGGNFSLRTLDEVAKEMNYYYYLGLPVAPPIATGKDFFVFPYIEGIRLRELLKENNIGAINSTLLSIFQAHQQNITYGDRFPKNIIVKPDNSVAHIDFDIKITGPYAKEFELSQIISCIVRDSSDKNIATDELLRLLNDYKIELKNYDLPKLKEFITGYGEYYLQNEKLDISIYLKKLLSELDIKN